MCIIDIHVYLLVHMCVYISVSVYLCACVCVGVCMCLCIGSKLSADVFLGHSFSTLLIESL